MVPVCFVIFIHLGQEIASTNRWLLGLMNALLLLLWFDLNFKRYDTSSSKTSTLREAGFPLMMDVDKKEDKIKSDFKSDSKFDLEDMHLTVAGLHWTKTWCNLIPGRKPLSSRSFEERYRYMVSPSRDMVRFLIQQVSHLMMR